VDASIYKPGLVWRYRAFLLREAKRSRRGKARDFSSPRGLNKPREEIARYIADTRYTPLFPLIISTISVASPRATRARRLLATCTANAAWIVHGSFAECNGARSDRGKRFNLAQRGTPGACVRRTVCYTGSRINQRRFARIAESRRHRAFYRAATRNITWDS